MPPPLQVKPKMSPTTSLHKTTVHHRLATGNKTHILFHLLLILSVFYHRLSTLINPEATSYTKFSPTAWICMILAELILALLWLFSQSFRWRPITREAYPEKLSGDRDLPGLDIFVCTADPSKEPTLEVMNTVISAMCLDYPPDKLAVYLSDDAGAAVTLNAMREAAVFARWWVPFCRKYNLKNRCPEVYFSGLCDGDIRGSDFLAEEENMLFKYEHFKKLVVSNGDVTQVNDVDSISSNSRPPVVQVIHDNCSNNDDDDIKMMPLLVYVSREKLPSYPHHFKAGALNALLRVSGIISNGPYIAVLDCDMFCNDPTSAKQAMCLHLDSSISSELSFVQFPQVFHNVTKNDIYDAQTRVAFKTMWRGMDGLMGPVLTGTGYYLKRKALYGSPDQEDIHLQQADALSFGDSNMFIASINGKIDKVGASTEKLLHEAHLLARCSFEKGTKWGHEIGYLYECLLESTFTGYYMQCKGWTSMYLYPKKPAFLGCAPIDMKDGMIQLRKWSGNLLELGFSKFSPLTYVISSRMSFLHSMCYAYFSFMPVYSISFLIYGTVPQFCFVKGISLFPKVNDAWFIVFFSLFLSSLLQNMCEVSASEGTLRTWWNEQRIWVIKSVTGCLFGCIDFIMKKIGNSKTKFRLTNKAISEEKVKNYKKGKFDFEGAQVFMVPMVALVIWNLVCLMGGLWSIIEKGNASDMFGQLILSTFVLLVSYPVIEGIVTWKGK